MRSAFTLFTSGVKQCQQIPKHNSGTIMKLYKQITIITHRAANPCVKPKIGRFCGPNIGRNNKHFHDNQRHTNTFRLFWPTNYQMA